VREKYHPFWLPNEADIERLVRSELAGSLGSCERFVERLPAHRTGDIVAVLEEFRLTRVSKQF
jgi:hypothetical protein